MRPVLCLETSSTVYPLRRHYRPIPEKKETSAAPLPKFVGWNLIFTSRLTQFHFLRTKICTSLHASSRKPCTTVRFTSRCRTVGLPFDSYCLSHLWLIEFGHVSWIFG